MDTTIILTVISIVVAIVIGVWQIQLARKQLHFSKKQISGSAESKNHKNENNSAIKDTKIDEREYRKRPYPGDIFNETDRLPLIQRHEARNNYVGLKVKWQGTIQNLYLAEENLVALTIRVDDHGISTHIYCKVKASDYPEVKIAKDGHGILVYGEIKSVGNADIDLMNCKIKLD